MTFDALLANVCHASTNWWKANKNHPNFRWYLLLLFWCILFF